MSKARLLLDQVRESSTLKSVGNVDLDKTVKKLLSDLGHKEVVKIGFADPERGGGLDIVMPESIGMDSDGKVLVHFNVLLDTFIKRGKVNWSVNVEVK